MNPYIYTSDIYLYIYTLLILYYMSKMPVHIYIYTSDKNPGFEHIEEHIAYKQHIETMVS